MTKLTVKLGLLFALTVILFAACEKDTLVNNTLENFQLQSAEKVTANTQQTISEANQIKRPSKGDAGAASRATVTDCGITVNTSGLTITLTANSYAPQFTIVTVTTQNWSYAELLCNDHVGNSCTSGNSLTVPNAGNYVVHVQSGGVNCSFNIYVDGIGGTDNDGDGIDSSIDCDDNDASVGAQQPVGTACNDGNPNTSNDVIQSGGCICQGTTGCNSTTDCGITVDVCDLTITLTNNSYSPQFTIVTVTTQNWSYAELLCNDHVGNSCTPGNSLTVPNAGNYVVHVQSGGVNCSFNLSI